MACGAPRSTVAYEQRNIILFMAGAAFGAVSGPQIRIRTGKDLARQRRRRSHRCWDHIIAAPLWPMHGANLGTLLRTCDAVGACLAVPRLSWVPEALDRGNTLRRPACVHWTGQDACRWLEEQRSAGSHVVGVELADEAIRLADLPAARRRTIAVLGHERTGIPAEAVDLLDVAVEIPMIGSGASLNVAVAGSLVLYRLAGLI
jgi:tRNA (guanosine-2'-O-)-methyltransferase